MNPRASIHRCASLVLAIVLLLGGRCHGQDAAAAEARQEIGAQIEELGTTLKAAAMSGAISDDDAWAIYDRVVRAAKASYVRDFGQTREQGNSAPEAEIRPKRHVVRLMPPPAERMDVLLLAEFQRRDVRILQETLDLDRDQMLIVEVLFDDYINAFELASLPLREAMTQYRGAQTNLFIASALQDAGIRLDAAVENARRADRDEAVARVAATLERIDRDKQADLTKAGDEEQRQHKAWRDRMTAAASELDDRLAAIRERTTRQLTGMGEEAGIDPTVILQLAVQLREDRHQLRDDLVTSIHLVTTEAQRGEDDVVYDSVLARIRVGRLLSRGRLGGESMNLWATFDQVRRDVVAHRGDDRDLTAAKAMIARRARHVATALDGRTDATIDREIAGLEFRRARDQVAETHGESVFEMDDRRLATLTEPYRRALRREVTAAVAVRDELLGLLDDVTASLTSGAPTTEVAARFRGAALRRGFPAEMRDRWSERALAAALRLPAMDDEVVESLRLLEIRVDSELRARRENAIDLRVRRDPALAIDFIDAEFGETDVRIDDDVWQEIGSDGFERIDDQVESALRGILNVEQFDSLPRRRAPGASGKPKPGQRGKQGKTDVGKGKAPA